MYLLFSIRKYRTLAFLKSELKTAAIVSAKQIDPEHLTGLYQEGKINKEGKSDDYRYEKIMKELEEIHQLNPSVYLFVFVQDKSFQSNNPEEIKIVYLVDIWTKIDKDKSTFFKESVMGTKHHFKTLTKGTVEFRDFYEDEWGKWITYYAPIKDGQGNVVGAVGADIETVTIREIKHAIATRFLVFSAISFPLLLIIVYSLGKIVTSGFQQVRVYAEEIGKGNYRAELQLDNNSFLTDERIILSQVLQEMTTKIKNREDFLKGVFNQVAVGIAIVSENNKITMINDTLCRILGYKKKDLTNANYLDYIYRNDIKSTSQYIEDNFANNIFSPPSIEKRFIQKNGQIKWLEIGLTLIPAKGRNSPYFGENKPYFIAVFQDVSLRRQAQTKFNQVT